MIKARAAMTLLAMLEFLPRSSVDKATVYGKVVISEHLMIATEATWKKPESPSVAQPFRYCKRMITTHPRVSILQAPLFLT